MFGRVFGLAFDRRRLAASSPVAVALLVAANAIPIVGVLWLGWDLLTIVRIYWLENGVVGLYAILRILTAADAAGTVPASGTMPGPGATPGPIRVSRAVTKAFTVPFFAFHYGIFWLGHGAFVWFAFPLWFAPGALAPAPGMGVGDPFADPFTAVGAGAGTIAAVGVALLISHGASFLLNWIGRGEYRTATTSGEMSAPYARVIVLHLTIILGAFAIAMLGAPVWALVVMVVVKTIADLAAHVKDRERAQRRAGA
jgi:hypothetical protein